MDHNTAPVPTITVAASWDNVFTGEGREQLERALPACLLRSRWFGGKARTIERLSLEEAIPFDYNGPSGRAFIAIVRVEYADGGSEAYVLPLTFASHEAAGGVSGLPHQVVAEVLVTGAGATAGQGGQDRGVLYDATWDRDFAAALLQAVERRRTLQGPSGEIVASSTHMFEPLLKAGGQLEPSVLKAEQSNTSIVYGRAFILKLFRRLEEGISPELEVGRFLTARGFPNIPPLAGALEYVRRQASGTGEPVTLAILQGFVPNQGDAWRYTLASLDEYFERAFEGQAPPTGHLLDLAGVEAPPDVHQAIGPYLVSAELLGRRTAELHMALASGVDEPHFAPEPFSTAYQQALHRSIADLTERSLRLMGGRLQDLPEDVQTSARLLFERGPALVEPFGPLLDRPISALRTRCHGDYHLGQVLYTGSDFVIIDFEGEPVRSLEERRMKHSPLKDVAGMLRSFHYAAYAALFNRVTPRTPASERARLERLAGIWHTWVSAGYLREYLLAMRVRDGGPVLLPPARHELRLLLDAYLLEKAVYELVYELNNRPDWVRIPMQGILQLVNQATPA